MLEKSIYPIKRWRVRATPIVQEPEWQYDDNDVAAAWRHVLPEVLDAVQPHEFYATAAASVKALGHWPVARVAWPWAGSALAPCGSVAPRSRLAFCRRYTGT
mgnify:CR=1 FL=1